MPQAPLVALLEYLGKTCAATELESLPDAHLLERFLGAREEAAFAVLMHRHGPMVYGVCRRVLGDGPDADDAFQATFLVLVRRAASLRPEAPLANWLYGVAQRVALKARAKTAARHDRQREFTDMPRQEPLADTTWQELRPLLDEEIGRLPEQCRAPMVLCYFEGKSYDQAAQELGWPKSTLASRLARGRDLLRQRLVQRGITLSAAAVATALVEKAAQASVAALLTINTVKAAGSVAAGKPIAQGVLSARALALAEETMKTMTGMKGKLVALLLVLGLAVGAVFAGSEAWVRPTPPQEQAPGAQGNPPKKAAAGPAVDLHGDPLPAGAVARLGQDRWLHGMMAPFVAFLPDGKRVVTVSEDRTVRVWAFPSGKQLLRIALPGPNIAPNAGGYRIRAALSDDGNTIATWIAEKASAVYLHNLASGNPLPPLQVTSAVSGLTFSPDRVHLACLTKDGKVRIWDWAKAKEVGDFPAGKPIESQKIEFPPPGQVNFGSGGAICYAPPDGKAIATRVGKQVKLWNPATRKEIATLRSEETGNPLTLAFSPDGKMLAISITAAYFIGGVPTLGKAKAPDDAVVLVEPATGKELGKLTVPKLRLNPSSGGPGLVFSKDGKRIYASDIGGELWEWDTATRKLLRQYSARDGVAMCASLSPDGSTLVRSGLGPHLLDLRGKDITLLHQRAAALTSLRFTPDGKELLTMPSARKWDAKTGKALGKVDLHGILGPVAISPDNKFLAGFRKAGPSFPKTVLIEAASGKELPVKLNASARIRFSPDSKMLAFGQNLPRGQGGKIELYDLSAAKLRHTFATQGDRSPVPARPYPNPQTGRTLIFSPEGKLLAAHADPKTLGIWDTRTGRRIGSLPLPQDAALVYVYARAHPNCMDSAAFSPDGRCLVLDRDDGTAVLYELATGQPRRTFGKRVAHKEFPKMDGASDVVLDEIKAGSCFAFSADGTLLARGGYDRIVHLWDVQTGRTLAAFKGHDGAVTALAFSPNGKTLASGSADSTALVWDLSNIKRPALPAKALERGDLERYWQALAEKDAAKAWAAMTDLVAAPKNAVPFLEKQLKPAAALDLKRVRDLIGQLDDPQLTVRDAAAKELLQLGDQIVPALDKALAANPPVETKRRLEDLRGQVTGLLLHGEGLRAVRAVEVLELIGTREARQVLNALADGAPGALLTRSALAALKR